MRPRRVNSGANGGKSTPLAGWLEGWDKENGPLVRRLGGLVLLNALGSEIAHRYTKRKAVTDFGNTATSEYPDLVCIALWVRVPHKRPLKALMLRTSLWNEGEQIGGNALDV